MCHLFVDFLANTRLANHVRYLIFVMNSKFDSLLISSSMATFFSLPTLYYLCNTSLAEGSAARRLHTTLVLIPGMSEGSQTNKSMLLWLMQHFLTSLFIIFIFQSSQGNYPRYCENLTCVFLGVLKRRSISLGLVGKVFANPIRRVGFRG